MTRSVMAVSLATLASGALAEGAPPGALACSGCHGAGATLSLDALSAGDIVDAMQAFRSGTREATLMTRIALGFDETEIAAIATWLAEGR